MLETIEHDRWGAAGDPGIERRALEALERGAVLLLPRLSFALEESERAFLDPAISDGRAKNVSYDPKSGRGAGTRLEGRTRESLNAMIARFAERSQSLVRGLLPRYASQLELARTSFRPCEVEDRPQNLRKDDRRLHIDAFPSQPVQGRRILRIFCNVNPMGQPRVWNVGEPFEDFAQRFAPRVRRPPPGAGWLLQRLGITKGRRTEYDGAMLQLHDLVKLDSDYQRTAPQGRVDLAAGATWLVFTDRVLHAALAGQHIFEQTFLLPVDAMQDQQRAPLRILERLLARKLA
jgi:hypothetical protein